MRGEDDAYFSLQSQRPPSYFPWIQSVLTLLKVVGVYGVVIIESEVGDSMGISVEEWWKI